MRFSQALYAGAEAARDFRLWLGRRMRQPSHAAAIVGGLGLAGAAGAGHAWGWRGVLGALLVGVASGAIIGQRQERQG